MAPLARRERAALTDLMDRVGPDAPTLCGQWTTFDLAAHLLLREASPLAAAALVPVLDKLNDKGMEQLKAKRSYAQVVQAVRDGPPWYSPLRPARIDRSANTMEFYIHHEDVRRAGAEPQPRDLGERDQHLLWLLVRKMGRLLARKAQVGIELVRTDVADSARISGGEPTLVVRGLPSELSLFAYGRGAVADVEIGGDAEARAAYSESQLGI
jgi:uncharacterized protein (TIGR03085 family)